MKIFNRCPSCKRLILGYKKVKNKDSVGKGKRYKNFCPHCGVELIIEFKNKVMFWMLITFASVGLLFLLKEIRYFFSEKLMVNGKLSLALWYTQTFAYLISFVAFAIFVGFIRNKIIEVKGANRVDEFANPDDQAGDN